MSWEAVGVVFNSGVLTGNDLLVAVCLANIADEDGGRIYPSKRRIAWQLGLSEATVKRVLRRLERRGLLSRADGTSISSRSSGWSPSKAAPCRGGSK